MPPTASGSGIASHISSMSKVPSARAAIDDGSPPRRPITMPKTSDWGVFILINAPTVMSPASEPGSSAGCRSPTTDDPIKELTRPTVLPWVAAAAGAGAASGVGAPTAGGAGLSKGSFMVIPSLPMVMDDVAEPTTKRPDCRVGGVACAGCDRVFRPVRQLRYNGAVFLDGAWHDDGRRPAPYRRPRGLARR